MCSSALLLIATLLVVACVQGGDVFAKRYTKANKSSKMLTPKASKETKISSPKAFKSKKYSTFTGSSKVFKTSKSDHHSTGTQSPSGIEYVTSSSPVSSTSPPTIAATLTTTCPSIPPIANSPVTCIPTVGPCITDASTLNETADGMNDNDVISLCGEIDTIETVKIQASNATICCDKSSTSPCKLRSSDLSMKHQLMHVSGENFTLSDIGFEGGKGDINVKGGGNLAIIADGDHLIEDCIFRDGIVPSYKKPTVGSSFGYTWTSGCGHNLFAETNHSLTVHGSTFSQGGLCVYDATDLKVDDSKFVNNILMLG